MKRSATEQGCRWYYRLTLRDEQRLVEAIGDIEGMHYLDAIARVGSRPGLAEIIREAADKAGDTGKPPLVDRDLVDHIQQNRYQSRPKWEVRK